MIPQGWTDTNGVLTAPNGVHVVHGFRDYVLSHNWDPGNIPLDAEFGTSFLEASNPSLGGGTQQLFNWTMLGYTTQRGVFFEWGVRELAFCRTQVAKYYAQTKQDALQIQQLQAQAQTDATTIAQLKAELAAATVPTIQGIDPVAAKAFQTSAGLKTHALVQGAQDLETFITSTTL